MNKIEIKYGVICNPIFPGEGSHYIEYPQIKDKLELAEFVLKNMIREFHNSKHYYSFDAENNYIMSELIKQIEEKENE